MSLTNDDSFDHEEQVAANPTKEAAAISLSFFKKRERERMIIRGQTEPESLNTTTHVSLCSLIRALMYSVDPFLLVFPSKFAFLGSFIF